MADSDPMEVAVTVDLETRQAKLKDALEMLNAHRSALEKCTVAWNEIEEVLRLRESALKEREDQFLEKEKVFEESGRARQEALDRREGEIVAKEAAAAQRVQELKDAAIAAVAEEKRKWESAQKTEVARVNVEAEASYLAASKVNLEESAQISIAREAAANALKEGSSPATPAAYNASKDKSLELAIASGIAFGHAIGGAASASPLLSEVKVRPELKALCKGMDGPGLMKFLLGKRKDVAALRSELPAALQHAIDPASLVLNILESYPEGTNDKRDPTTGPAKRRVCISLLECLASLTESGQSTNALVVPASVQAASKKLADRWIAAGIGSDENATLDAQAILQLLATFGIASQYSVEELCKYVTLIARRKQSAVLCRSLGLTDKMPELVDRLAKEGKQVEALRFAYEFGIMDRVQPVPMLKGYLKEAKKAAAAILKNGNNSAAAQNESTVKEMSALRTVLRCIEEYGVEAQYPSLPLKKRVEQLEKAKADRKRAAASLKAQTKRPRAGDDRDRGQMRADTARYGAGLMGARPVTLTSPPAPTLTSYPGTLAYASGQVTTAYAGGSSYDRRSSGGGQQYNGSGGSPLALSSSYLYTTTDSPQTVVYTNQYTTPAANQYVTATTNQYSTPATTTYSSPQGGSYSDSYQFGSGLPPPPPAYQSAFKH